MMLSLRFVEEYLQNGNKAHYVYVIWLNGSIYYVGCTMNPYERFKQHISCANTGSINKISYCIAAHMNIKMAPVFQIVFAFETKREALDAEKAIIQLNLKTIKNGSYQPNENRPVFPKIDNKFRKEVINDIKELYKCQQD